jgi:tripartite ATP-independent transporter DctM subunit
MTIVIVFIVGLAVGVPIAFVLGGTGVLHALILDNANLFTTLPKRMFSAVNNSNMMAIPLFVLAGELMGYGGITERLCNMVRAFIGHIRGGMAYTTVGVGTFLGALLGSANASAALLGRVMKPELDKDGYADEFSASLVAATAILGPIIPPSMNFIVYGVAASVSIGAMFLAGIVPGLMIAVFFTIIIFFSGRKRKNTWKIREKQNFMFKMNAVLKALPCLLVPITILGGIFTGATTPTESAATASFIAFILGMFFYHKLKWRHIPQILVQTGLTSAVVLIIVAMANIMGYMLTLDRIPQKIASFILSLTSNRYQLLLLMNLFLFLVGMVMETVASIIILVPILLPIAQAAGIDPLHFGIVMCINLIIGLVTPPVGVTLFTTSLVTKVPLRKLIRPIWVWVGAAAAVLFLITYIPNLVLFIPSLNN